MWHFCCLQYATDFDYNGVATSLYISSFSEGDKNNNYTLLVDKSTQVSH